MLVAFTSVVGFGQRPASTSTAYRTGAAAHVYAVRRLCLAQCAARLIAIVALLAIRLGGVDQRRVKPLRIHGLVQKAAPSGADLTPRIAADEERWNRGKCWNRERAAEPFDGVDSSRSS